MQTETMNRRLLLCVLLVAVSLPASARRRAITPSDPSRCHYGAGPIVTSIAPSAIAIDGSDVYFDDVSGIIYAAPVTGGALREVGSIGENFLISLAVDDASVYAGVLPIDAIFEPQPGAILRAPKSGGEFEELVRDVPFPWELKLDGTHLYWVNLGSFDLATGMLASDGSIGRIATDGSNRTIVASDLSAPSDVAFQGNDVLFSQTGLADDDQTVGLFRVAGGGGDVTTVRDDVFVFGIATSGDSIVVTGAQADFSVGVFRISGDGSAVAMLAADDEVGSVPRVIDGRVYYMAIHEDDSGVIRVVDVDTPETVTDVVSGNFSTTDFEVDPCSIVYGLIDPEEVRRIRRD